MTHFDSWLDPRVVAIGQCEKRIGYPTTRPFRPGSNFAELSRVSLGKEPNYVYDLCRSLFLELRLDLDNYSTSKWNPLGGLIRPGMKVLCKPNLVRHIHMQGGVYECVVTHASVVRCLLDYVALALKGEGEIIVGDAPVQSADFKSIVRRTGLQEVCEDVSKTWAVPVKMVDFRLLAVELDANHCVVDSQSLAGDISGYRAVDLGQRSMLAPLSHQHERFRVTSYDCREMVTHHNNKKNEYLIPKSVLDADVVISVPKLKTHRKVGLTAALKNLVGINGHKDWLPHHREGALSEGGDEYFHPSRIKKLKSEIEGKMIHCSSLAHKFYGLGATALKKLSLIAGDDPYEEGSWYGNDTIWRMVLDLNRALIYADREGVMQETPQRKCFSVVDGILAGEGEGPMEPDARLCGVLLAGRNPVAIDAVLATMIGFNYRKIPIIANGFSVNDWPLVSFNAEDIMVVSRDSQWNMLPVGFFCDALRFKPPSGWIGHVEFEEVSQGTP